MKKLLLLSIALIFLVCVAQALPNASISINRTGDLGAIPQTILVTNTTTEPEQVTAYNLSLQGIGNNTVWYNATVWPAAGYEYTYHLAGNFTPYLIVEYSGGTNQSTAANVNTSWGAPVGIPGLNRTGDLGIFPQVISYADASYYNISAIIIDWGDGNVTATTGGASGSFTYNVPGNYTLTHYAVSFEGNTSTSYKVNVSHAIPTASFSCTRTDGSTNLNGTRPFTVICNDTMNNPVTAWDARDWYGTCLSTNQTTRNISMTCTFGGYKSVGMIASNEAGKSTQYRQNYIWVMKFQGQGFTPQESIWQQILDFLHDVFGIGSG